ncbi:molecular chaperone [Providencia vermicola]|uniref:Molecular chaperone n=1 Tax=Providencia vermicola TaxID=333965 RepID=A0AAX3S1V8_9GAMM|nr:MULTISPECIES: molecular chaperone [Providencia]ELR5122947.1 molecular chaperone [Providencia stuartii]ELX8379861.1 molecular chaperone [Providencia stuartii]EMD5259251.1 molecular chaperone [Providencia stuartii]USB38270.1 molecular chaperone [Providencia vermicola]WFC07205.1 molecular chaperone [Providencia vermicola]
MKNWASLLITGFMLSLLFGVMPSSASDFESASSDTLVFPYERKTFIEGDKSVSFRLRNATTTTPYLVQASIEKLDEVTGVNTLGKADDFPFMITPPLHKLEPGQRYDWRVMFVGDTAKMPSDRETVYIAKFRAIPPSTPNTEGSQDTTEFDAIQALHFKVYYRPKSIKNLTLEDAQKKLSFRKEGNELVVMNNSPIYLAFDSVSVGGNNIDSNELFKPLKPLSEQRFKLPKTMNGNQLKWTVLDELVLPMKEQTGTLQ